MNKLYDLAFVLSLTAALANPTVYADESTESEQVEKPEAKPAKKKTSKKKHKRKNRKKRKSVAQERPQEPLPPSPAQDETIRDLSDRLAVIVPLEIVGNQIGINYPGLVSKPDGSLEGLDLTYSHPLNWTLGPKFSYKFFSVQYRFKLPVRYPDEPDQGNTDLTDVRGQFFLNNISFDFAYQDYRGFYVRNPVYDADTSPDDVKEFLTVPSMHAKTVTAMATFVSDADRWSYRSPFEYTERQIKPGGSFLASLKVTDTELSADDSLLPESLREAAGEASDLRFLDRRALTIGVGWGGTHAEADPPIFVSGVAGLGLGLQQLSYKLGEKPGKQAGTSWSFDLRVAFGWHTDDYVGGMTYVWLVDSFNVNNDISMNNSVYAATLFSGWRL